MMKAQASNIVNAHCYMDILITIWFHLMFHTYIHIRICTHYICIYKYYYIYMSTIYIVRLSIDILHGACFRIVLTPQSYRLIIILACAIAIISIFSSIYPFHYKYAHKHAHTEWVEIHTRELEAQCPFLFHMIRSKQEENALDFDRKL